MKRIVSVIAATAVVAVHLAAALGAQRGAVGVPLRMNPPYLSQFPSADRVKAEIKGTDAMDTAARQMGAFWQLQEIVKLFAGQRLYRDQLTAEEKRLLGEYSAGYQRAALPYAHIERDPSHPDKAKWYQMHAFYETDRAFAHELLNRLGSPDLVAEYSRAKGQSDAQAVARSEAATRAREAAAAPVAPPRTSPPAQVTPATPPGPPPGGRAAAPPVATPRTVDPSIAKARAAKVDTTVFGIPLGEPLQIRECDSVRETLAPTNTCVNTMTSALTDLAASILPLPVERNRNETFIVLGKDSCPTWMATCQVTATLHDGFLAGVTLTTRGRGVEQATARELRGKYGAPTASKNGIITPDVGNAFNITDLEWTLPGLHVDYQVVAHEDTDSTRVTTDQGVVRIETESEYQRRAAKIKEATRRKL